MRSAIAIIVSLVVILVVDSSSWAQRYVDTVRGNVRVTGGAVSPNSVRVQLQKFGLTIQEMFLRESGFEFRNVEEGRYTLVVDAPGYIKVQEDIEVPGERPIVLLRPDGKTAQQPAEGVPVWALRIPESARRQFETAKNKLQEDNCGDALKHLKKAVRVYAEYGDAHYAMGQCY